jgi:hypothetical protein
MVQDLSCPVQSPHMATQFIRRCKQKIIIQSAANDTNEDLLPTPPEQRTWTWWTYSSLWAGQSFDATWVRGTSSLEFSKPTEIQICSGTWGVCKHIICVDSFIHIDYHSSLLDRCGPYCSANSGARINWVSASRSGSCVRSFFFSALGFERPHPISLG